MTMPWWAEYPECVDAHNKAVKAYKEYIDNLNNEILEWMNHEYPANV
jgi:hypothetical protein